MVCLTSDSRTKLRQCRRPFYWGTIDGNPDTYMTEMLIDNLKMFSHTSFAAPPCSEDLLKPAASAHIHRMARTKQISERYDTEQRRVSLCRHSIYELTIENSVMRDSVIEWANISDQILTSMSSIHQTHPIFEKAYAKWKQCRHGYRNCRGCQI